MRFGWVLVLAVGVVRLAVRARDLYRIEDPYSGFGLLPAHAAKLSDEYGVMGVGYLIKGGLTGVLDDAAAFDFAYVVAHLVLGALLVLVAAVPLRRGHRWAWWACWAVVAADVVDGALFGPYSAPVLATSALTAGLLTVLLLQLRPASVPRGATV